MEILIPTLALGGIYFLNNRSKSKAAQKSNIKPKSAELYENMGKPANYLPNTAQLPQNYPVQNDTLSNPQVVESTARYPSPNDATDSYFNQNYYELAERDARPVGSEIQNIYSLTGNYLSADQFTHQNMVPFDGGKPKGQIYNNNIAETVLDNYVGSGSQTIKKIEQAPLFAPQENVQWTYGTPNMTEFLLSRENPATKQHMVKPFESEMVGPGLDQGYTSAGTGGYNSGMEARDKWLPKTVDELRTVNNPKLEYNLLGHEGPADAAIKNRGIMGAMERHRPDTYFIQTQDRWLTTTGEEKAPRMRADEDLPPTMRNETEGQYYGAPAGGQEYKSPYAPRNYQKSNRQESATHDVQVSSAVGRGPQNIALERRMISAKESCAVSNNRSGNQQAAIFGSGFASAIGAAVAPIMDVLRPVHKDEYVCNMRMYGAVSGSSNRNMAPAPENVPAPTIRETTMYQPHGFVGNNQQNGAYMAQNIAPMHTQRASTSTDVFGNAGVRNGAAVYDAAYTTPMNNDKKEATASYAYTTSGNAKQHNAHIGQVWMPQDGGHNTRESISNKTWFTGPSTDNMGVFQMRDAQANTRFDPNLTAGQLQQNEYALPPIHAM